MNIDYSNKQLEVIPNFSQNVYENCTKLKLEKNKIGINSNKLSKFKRLKVLNLSDNIINKFPSEILNLTTLKALFLNNNYLEILPNTIEKLNNLRTLSLSSNKLSILPNSIGNLSKLSKLYLSNNKLESLPESFCKLENLSTLILANNKLNYLPKEFAKLTKLTRLDLTGNNLPLPTNIPVTNPKAIIDYVLKNQNRKTTNIFNLQKIYVFQNLSMPNLQELYSNTLSKAFKKWGVRGININTTNDIDENTTVVFLIVTWDIHKNKKLVNQIIEKCKNLQKEFYILLQPDKYITLDAVNKKDFATIFDTHNLLKENYFDNIIEYKDLDELTLTIKDLVQKHTPSIKITNLKLENIGHFENIDIDISKKVTCFIGENGTGKTTVLRAISLALIGDKHKKINAHKLKRYIRVLGIDEQKNTIFSEKSKISLTFTIDGDEFTNELNFDYSNSSDELKITNNNVSEVIVNDNSLKILMVGFPQIRSEINFDNDYSAKRFKQPHVNDLIPLINNQDEDRLNSFIDWIINLDGEAKNHEIERAKSNSNKPIKERVIIKKAFKIISKLADSTIEFKDITQIKPPLVWITTNDAPNGISMDLLAQGFKEIIGWIGYFIQRMVESYPLSLDFTQKPAIVLVDEIDAFCHPKWQIKLLNVLQEFFPKVQFIVSSHSPLITLEREENEIKELYNSKNNIKVKNIRRNTKNTNIQTNLLTIFELSSLLSPSLQTKVDLYYKLKLEDENNEKLNDLEIELDKAMLGLPIHDYRYLLFLKFLKKKNIDPFETVEKFDVPEMSEEEFLEYENEYKKYL